MQIINLYAVSYLRQMHVKALLMAEKEKKEKFVHPCLERRRSFTQMVYSADGILGTEAVAAQQRLALLLNNNMKREY